MFLNSFAYFRAVAIFLIVVGHSLGILEKGSSSFVLGVINNLILGATALFVFISGYLFHHVFYKRYKYPKFLIGKMKNVLVPYLILSFPAILIYMYIHDYWAMSLHDLFINGIWLLWSGEFLIAYWYIPFILLTFLVSPLHYAYIKLSLRSQVLIILIFLLVAVLIHRPILNTDPIQSFIYYTPVYLIGIVCSLYKESLYSYLKGKDLFLLGLTVFFAILQVYMGHVGNYHKLPFAYGGVDWMLLQKISMCFFFLVFFLDLKIRNIRVSFLLPIQVLQFSSFIHIC